ncbi:MAG: SH3 domain-containing protein [Bdellovibrionales bacterium]
MRFLLVLAALFLIAAPTRAEDMPAAEPVGEAAVTNGIPQSSGMPIPRFVTLRTNEINLRAGPSVNYPIDWVYIREGLPVEITAEYDTWRRIRDIEGTEGWVHQSMLSGKRSLIVTGDDLQPMYAKADSTAEIVARAQPNAMGQLEGCENAWCEVRFPTADGEIDGYMPKASFWGAYADEVVQ